MQHFNNNFRTIEKNNAQWSRQAHLFVGFCQIYAHARTHNRWWNIKINDWKRQWRQRSTIVSRKNERTREKSCNNRHMFVHIPIASICGCLLLVSFSLSFAIVLVSTTTPFIAQSVVCAFDHSTFQAAYRIIFMLLLYFKDTQTHAGTDSIHLFLKYNIMTISSSPLRSIFCVLSICL